MERPNILFLTLCAECKTEFQGGLGKVSLQNVKKMWSLTSRLEVRDLDDKCVCVCIHIFVYRCVCVYIHVYRYVRIPMLN